MKLLASDASGAFAPPRGLVRSTKSGDKVRNLCVGGDANLCDVVEGDISSADALRTLCDGVDALVMLTSAVPKPKIGSMIAALVSKILPWAENKRPDFYFPEGGSPREVDYEWQVAQIDAPRWPHAAARRGAPARRPAPRAAAPSARWSPRCR